MSFNYDELYARYADYAAVHSPARLQDWLFHDVDLWMETGRDPQTVPERCKGVDGLFTYDEVVYLLNQLDSLVI